NDLFGAIRPAVGTDDAVGVGEVAGDRVETQRLRRERAAGDVEDVEYAHGDQLCTAALSMRIWWVMKAMPASYWIAFCANSARSASISTLLPSALVCAGVRYIRRAVCVALAALATTRWRGEL